MREFKQIALSAAFVSATILSTQADTLYNNVANNLNTTFGPNNVEFGDQVILAAPAGGVLTNFTFQYYLTAPSGNEAVQVRLYKNDGPAFNGYATPGSVLYNSGSIGLSGFSRDGNGIGQLSFDSADFLSGSFNGVVPQEITWTVLFSGVTGGEQAGLSLYDPPSVGGGYDDYWDNDGSGFQLRQVSGTPMSFGASFAGTAAVPEPSTLILGAVGGLLGLVLRSRSRRS